MTDSAADIIEKRIARWKKGRIFFPSDFADIASDGAVRITLMRLCREEKIVRIATGIYCTPSIETKYGLGLIIPGAREIAKAVAKHDKIKICPSGAYAQNVLGLSTQVAANAWFITNGAPRKIKLGGKMQIIFTHSSRAKDSAYKSELMQLIVAAIKETGEGLLYDEEKAILKQHLSHVPQKEYEHDIKLAPIWVRNTIMSL